MSSRHHDFTLIDSGLLVNEEFTFLGASPDCIQFCKCCGMKLIEVKSIYSKKNLKPSIVAEDKISYDSERSKWTLKTETSWYYQIQCQMAVTKVYNTDLVIYKNKGILILGVNFNQEFWSIVFTKLKDFYLKNMVPEILSRTIESQL